MTRLPVCLLLLLAARAWGGSWILTGDEDIPRFTYVDMDISQEFIYHDHYNDHKKGDYWAQQEVDFDKTLDAEKSDQWVRGLDVLPDELKDFEVSAEALPPPRFAENYFDAVKSIVAESEQITPNVYPPHIVEASKQIPSKLDIPRPLNEEPKMYPPRPLNQEPKVDPLPQPPITELEQNMPKVYLHPPIADRVVEEPSTSDSEQRPPDETRPTVRLHNAAQVLEALIPDKAESIVEDVIIPALTGQNDAESEQLATASGAKGEADLNLTISLNNAAASDGEPDEAVEESPDLDITNLLNLLAEDTANLEAGTFLKESMEQEEEQMIEANEVLGDESLIDLSTVLDNKKSKVENSDDNPAAEPSEVVVQEEGTDQDVNRLGDLINAKGLSHSFKPEIIQRAA